MVKRFASAARERVTVGEFLESAAPGRGSYGGPDDRAECRGPQTVGGQEDQRRELHAGARAVVVVAARAFGGGYIPRFRNLRLDFSMGGTPDTKYFGSWGEELQKTLDSVRGAT